VEIMEYIKIGAIANTHGLKGTVKVKSFTDFKEERYKKGNTLYIFFKNEYIPVTITNAKTVKGLEYIDFEGLTHINDVEKLKGSELFIDQEQIHVITDEDEFYYNDLIGCEIITDSPVGIVKDIREYPQGQYLVINTEEKKNILIPFLKQFVRDVDLKNRKIYLTEWEGLL